MRLEENYGILLSNLRSNVGLSQEMLAKCVQSSKSALSRLENGDVQQPFKGSVRKLVIRLAELLCSSKKETERYLRLAGIDLLTEREEFQLGFAPSLEIEAHEEITTLQRWAGIYQQLLEQLLGYETRCSSGNLPPQFKVKRQEYIQVLRAIQEKVKSLTEWKSGLKAKIAPLRAKPLPPVVSDGLFRVGKFAGTWISLDGDGTAEYRLENITTRYISSVEDLPEELQKRKESIAREQQERKEKGLSSAWNGEIYQLDHFVIGREPVQEEMTLDLWFRPSDYYTFLATNKSLDDPEVRAKYLQEPDWFEPAPFFSHSFGIALVVVTKDEYCLLTQRSSYQSINASTYSTAAVVESLSRPVDRRTDSFAPDLYRCACRGLSEELGLIERKDFSPQDILFLNFGVNSQYATYGMIGLVKVQRTCQEILDKWGKGVKDKIENKVLYPLPFTPEDYMRFVTEHRMVGESLYYALVHEFGREAVERVIFSY